MTVRRIVRRPLTTALAAVLLSCAVVSAPRAQESALEQRLEQMEHQLRLLQDEVERLRRQAAEERAVAESRSAELEGQVDALAEEAESRRLGEAWSPPTESRHGLGPSASKVYASDRGVSIGGYGEMLYEAFDSSLDDGTRSGKGDRLDFLRNVVYFGYKFNDRILFNSEIEIEHGSTSKSGSVSVELAYLDFLLSEHANIRAGMLLAPLGLVNEMHEPTTFLSARRSETERRIIPTTWRENGVGVFGDAGPVTYRAYVLNGLDAAGFSASGLRGGRQKGSQADAEDLAFAARIDVTPVEGLLVGASAYLGGSGQGIAGADDAELDVRTDIFDVHVDWRWRGLWARGLWARAEVDDVAALNGALGLTGDDSVGSVLEGWYAEVAWDVLSHLGTDQELMPFVRYEQIDTQRSVPAGFFRDPANDEEILTLGVAWRPHPQVIVKVDWQDVDDAAGTGLDQWNVALGYAW